MSVAKLDFSEAVEVLPPFNVIIHKDDVHSKEYIEDLLTVVFRHTEEDCKDLTTEIHEKGKAIVYTTHREKAELKAEQATNFGGDDNTGTTKPIKVTIEPA